MYMVMFVLDNCDFLNQLLDALAKAGLTGATIIDSTGLHRRRRKHLPLRYTYGDQPLQEVGNATLFMMVEDEEMIHTCLDAIEKVVGDLDEPNTGVFSAWPVSFMKGIRSHRGDA